MYIKKAISLNLITDEVTEKVKKLLNSILHHSMF